MNYESSYLYTSAARWLQEYSKHVDMIHVPEAKFGDMIFDVISVDANDNIRIIEIKRTRADFVGDKKWKKYLNYCNYFYFLAPHGIIKPEELPSGVGLIEVDSFGGASSTLSANRKELIHNINIQEFYKKLMFKLYRSKKNSLYIDYYAEQVS